MLFIQNLCRLCGKSNDQNDHPIFVDLSNDLLNKITKCLGLEASINDYKPKSVCDDCLIKLDDFNQFLINCHETDRNLETIWLNQQHQPSVIVNPKLKPTTTTTTTTIQKESQIFGMRTVRKKQTQKTPLNCPHCERQFQRRSSLNCHIATIHIKIRPFICDICEKSYANKCYLKNHQKIHTDKYKCEYCSRCFIAPSKLERHHRTHTKDRPFVCPYETCKRAFSDKRNLDSHQTIHFNNYDFHCLECNKAFKTNNRLKQHGRVHKNEKIFTCDLCSKQYKYRSNLIIHLKKHTGYYCPHCEENCEKLSVLIRHRKDCSRRPNNNLQSNSILVF